MLILEINYWLCATKHI